MALNYTIGERNTLICVIKSMLCFANHNENTSCAPDLVACLNIGNCCLVCQATTLKQIFAPLLGVTESGSWTVWALNHDPQELKSFEEVRTYWEEAGSKAVPYLPHFRDVTINSLVFDVMSLDRPHLVVCFNDAKLVDLFEPLRSFPRIQAKSQCAVAVVLGLSRTKMLVEH